MENKEVLLGKNIFTFWEPKSNIPAYVRLCMNTWKKFLPEYKIHVLDYSNLDEYLGKDCFDKILYKKFTLPQQADAIRCAVLKKYGGIWMDADTIITSKNIEKLLENDFEFSLVGWHIGFIIARANSYILQEWENGIKENLKKYKKLSFWRKIFSKKLIKNVVNWDYFGNSIINPYLTAENKFFMISKEDICALPEEIWAKEFKYDYTPMDMYRKFYFENDNLEYLLKNNKGLIMLHNSWTPKPYKQMDENAFLQQNCTLAKLLKMLNE